MLATFTHATPSGNAHAKPGRPPGNKFRPVEIEINAKCGTLKEWLLLH